MAKRARRQTVELFPETYFGRTHNLSGWAFRVRYQGRTVHSSQAYSRKADAVRGAKRAAPDAQIKVVSQ